MGLIRYLVAGEIISKGFLEINKDGVKIGSYTIHKGHFNEEFMGKIKRAIENKDKKVKFESDYGDHGTIYFSKDGFAEFRAWSELRGSGV